MNAASTPYPLGLAIQAEAVYLDQYAARLRAAVRDGLLPVAPLVSDAIRQLRDHLSHPERDPMLTHRPPEGWAEAAAWREEIERVIRDQVRPAIGRYADLLAELLLRSRPPEQPGLLYVPGGVPAYASCVRNGTTLPFDPDELHRLGLSALAEFEEQMAKFGAPPYYSLPARDGSRPGAYLFNDVQPGQAGSWALEATAFHEGVPGHHAQFARVQLLPDLPLLQTGFYVVPHGEGWGMYAERLADEFGLYSDDVQRLGMLGCAAWRAVRLVVDSGLGQVVTEWAASGRRRSGEEARSDARAELAAGGGQ